MEHIEFYITICALSYFLGSIPFGLIFSKMMGIQDLRRKGSGNIGATNALRVGGKKLGAAVFLCDGLKGFIAIMISMALAKHFSFNMEVTAAYSGLSAVVGHVFPIWLKFKGGKGVATSLIVFLTINPLVGALAITTWLLTFLLTRISSLSAILSMVSVAICSIIFMGQLGDFTAICFGAIVFLVLMRHYSNFVRLLRKEEQSFK